MRVKLGKVKKDEDVEIFQEKLNMVYKWAEDNNMLWNKLKFQLLRIGRNERLKDDTVLF